MTEPAWKGRSGAPTVIRGAAILDVGSGETTVGDLGILDGVVVPVADLEQPMVVQADGLTVMFGLWDCHAHPGGLMHDPTAEGYFDGAADWTVRAGANLMNAARMGVTGVRAVAEADRVDLAWARAFAACTYPGPRLRCAGAGLRTTGGHGTAFPRRPVDVQWEWTVDGADGMLRATRALIEQGVHWIKVMLTGGLDSAHESIDDPQFTEAELAAVMEAAGGRGVPVAAHCGSGRVAERFALAGGRSIEHGYALDERAAAAMAEAGTWLVPTIGVTHDTAMMAADGWPEHARTRAVEAAARHAAALAACVAAGVRIATGADLNPIGPRLHDELRMLEVAGMDRLSVLRSATTGGRALNGLGEHTVPEPGAAADLILVDGDPLAEPELLRRPAGVFVYGRAVVDPASR
ncbi:MAG: amidohydrolase family protein [Nakamurella sp.]